MSCLQSQLTGIWGTTGFPICVVCISGDNANRFSNKHTDLIGQVQSELLSQGMQSLR